MSCCLASCVEKAEFDHTHIPRPFAGSAFEGIGVARIATSKDMMIVNLQKHAAGANGKRIPQENRPSLSPCIEPRPGSSP